jgi:hypothetical protein
MHSRTKPEKGEGQKWQRHKMLSWYDKREAHIDGTWAGS